MKEKTARDANAPAAAETEREEACKNAPEQPLEPEERAEDIEAQTPREDPALAEARAQAEDFKRKWYSVTAEYENYRRRTAGESARRYREGRADVVSKLFPIADDLDRALASCADGPTKKGIEMVKKTFEKVLSEEHITAIDPAGEPFDAERHEAIMAVDPAEGEESGTVKSVYLKGYEQDGKVLRFAQVVVVK